MLAEQVSETRAYGDPRMTLIAQTPEETDGESLLFAFLDWAAEKDLELYSHQEEAILALLSGDHVVLATPTGSGKSLVAVAGAFAMVAQGKRAVYTAPIKARRSAQADGQSVDQSIIFKLLRCICNV